jgi:hypothetical protein
VHKYHVYIGDKEVTVWGFESDALRSASDASAKNPDKTVMVVQKPIKGRGFKIVVKFKAGRRL